MVSIKIKDYRELLEEQQINLFNNYVLKLSKYKEAYTDINEIKKAIKYDNDFYIYAIINVSNNDFLGHIQFKYLKETNIIIIDYVCLNSSSSKRYIYEEINKTLIDKFNYSQLLSEVTFFDNKRNIAITKVFKKYGLTDLGFKYIQPPTEKILPVFGKLLILEKEKNYNLNLIIKDIYLNHYGYWYKNRFLYHHYLSFLYKIQKSFLKKDFYKTVKNNIILDLTQINSDIDFMVLIKENLGNLNTKNYLIIKFHNTHSLKYLFSKSFKKQIDFISCCNFGKWIYSPRLIKNVLKINNLRIIKKEFNLFSSELTFICKSN